MWVTFRLESEIAVMVGLFEYLNVLDTIRRVGVSDAPWYRYYECDSSVFG